MDTHPSDRPESGDAAARGLRRLELRVWDTSEAGFADECVRQARRIRDFEAHLASGDTEDWHAVSDETGWTA